MRKNRMRLCAGVLAVVIALTGCTQATGGKTEPVNPVEVSERHYLTNTLHKVSVTDTGRSFVKDGKSEYKVIAGEDEQTQKAAFYLVKYIEQATGCELEFAKPKDYKANGKFIVMNVPKLFEEAGLVMPEDELGVMGYYIKSVQDNVFLTSNYETGARFAMLAFLRQVVGFKMYAIDAVTFDKDGSILPDMDIVEKPDVPYFYRMHSSNDEPEESYMMGFVTNGFISYGGVLWHNSLIYLPIEEYQKDHPKWYSTEGNDLCYTAHGDEKELEKMTTIIADKMLEAAEANPEGLFITCTIMDHNDVCLCETCAASAKKYNGSDAAAVVKFTNKINEKVQAELQRQADKKGTKKRPLTVMFFAYNGVTRPPIIENEDGTYSPVDESVVCDENVAVFYAPISAEFNHTFYEKENVNYYDMMHGWDACTEEIYCWLYGTNFRYYMYPYNCWDSMYETYRFCVDMGTPFIMDQEQHNAQASTSFTDLKDYMNSQAVFDLNKEYDAVLDDYFANYYLSANEPMRQYFDELRAWMRHLEATHPAEINGFIYAEIAQQKFWPKNMLEHWISLIDDAYAAAEEYKDQKVLYDSLIKRIKKESLFPRYALIEHYSGNYSAEALNEMKLSFKEDAKELNFDRVSESYGGEIELVYERWGIK